MPNFARPWCRNHMTHRDSWGIIGKIISVAFIWYHVVLCVTASLVTITSLKKWPHLIHTQNAHFCPG